MTVQVPTIAQLHDVAKQCGLSLADADLESFRGLMPGRSPPTTSSTLCRTRCRLLSIRALRAIARAGGEPAQRLVPKDFHQGASSGKLTGKKIALKDNVMLAGVPMMNGAATLEGFIPEFDAPIVTRMLDEGAEIIGKTHCEAFCLSGGSHTNATGPVHNPHKMGFSAGGSSSGSAVVVALGEADMAIGCDQGGSIRMPASFSGVYGMKPTWGLVPYTGIMPIEIFVDHTGPMTASVETTHCCLKSSRATTVTTRGSRRPKCRPIRRCSRAAFAG